MTPHQFHLLKLQSIEDQKLCYVSNRLFLHVIFNGPPSRLRPPYSDYRGLYGSVQWMGLFDLIGRQFELSVRDLKPRRYGLKFTDVSFLPQSYLQRTVKL